MGPQPRDLSGFLPGGVPYLTFGGGPAGDVGRLDWGDDEHVGGGCDVAVLAEATPFVTPSAQATAAVRRSQALRQTSCPPALKITASLCLSG